MQSDRSGELGKSRVENSRDVPSFSRQCNVEGQNLIRRAQSPTFEGENLCPAPCLHARAHAESSEERASARH
eukprot:7461800-Alexandrium_andersonii.AAC.1